MFNGKEVVWACNPKKLNKPNRELGTQFLWKNWEILVK